MTIITRCQQYHYSNRRHRPIRCLLCYTQ